MRGWKIVGVNVDLPASVFGTDEHYCLKELIVIAFGEDRVKKTKTHLNDQKGLKELPQLGMFLSDTELVTASGTVAREPGGIWIQPRGGVLRVVLKEPTQKLMMVLEVRNIASLLAVVEAALGAEGSMWEVDHFAKPKSKPRR